MRHHLFAHDKRCLVGKLCLCHAIGAVNALDLCGLHFHVGALGKLRDGGGVHGVFAVTVPLAIVLFDIFHTCVFAKVKGVNAAVLALGAAAVVDAAACHNGDIAILTDVKIVVDQLLETRLRKQHGDMQALLFCTGLYIDINAGLVGFSDDLDVFRVAFAKQLAVNAQGVGARGDLVNARHLL